MGSPLAWDSGSAVLSSDPKELLQTCTNSKELPLDLLSFLVKMTSHFSSWYAGSA